MLLAVHQALGGKSGKGSGGINLDGGLRSAIKQRQLYAICRCNLKYAQTVELPGPTITGAAGYRVPSRADVTNPSRWIHKVDWSNSTPDDWVLIGKSLRNKKNCPDGDAVTRSWVSWHNLGLAVDFGFKQDQTYYDTMAVASHIGMIWGGRWGAKPERTVVTEEPVNSGVSPRGGQSSKARERGKKRLVIKVLPAEVGWDPNHVEWHPRYFDVPEKFAGGVPGTAMTDAQMAPYQDYRWKLPARLFFYVSSRNGHTEYKVLDLENHDNFIYATRQRVIRKQQDGAWEGSWYTYKNPVPLFPAYISVTELHRSEGGWPEDRKWRRQTDVVVEEFNIDASAKITIAVRRRGTTEFYPHLRMSNVSWHAMNLVETAADDNEKNRFRSLFRALRKMSLYDIRLDIEELPGGSHQVDVCTLQSDGTYSSYSHTQELRPDLDIQLNMSWDRDKGVVGLDNTIVRNELGNPKDQYHQFREEKHTKVDDVEGVIPRIDGAGDRLPLDWWDQENPPAWPCASDERH
jgi:hypothetical protein